MNNKDTYIRGVDGPNLKIIVGSFAHVNSILGGGSDIISGGNNDDSLLGNGTIFGGADNDTIIGFNATSTLAISDGIYSTARKAITCSRATTAITTST